MQCCNNGITYVSMNRVVDGRIHDVVSDYNVTAAAKPDKHITRAVAMACTEDLFGLYWVDLHILLCHSSLLVRIAVFDLRAYDVQLKTKLQFKGRVNNNACAQSIFCGAQSCTIFCQL